MKLNNKALYIIAGLYLIVLLAMVINRIYLNYRVEYSYYVGILAYYALASITVYTIYKTGNMLIFMAMIIMLLFLTTDPLLYIPLFTLVPFLISRLTSNKIKIIARIIMGFGTILFMTFSFAFIIAFIIQPQPIIIERIASPDNQKILSSRYFDIGTVVNVRFEQKLFNENITISRVLYTTNAGNNVEMDWLDNNTVLINNERINIYTTDVITGVNNINTHKK